MAGEAVGRDKALAATVAGRSLSDDALLDGLLDGLLPPPGAAAVVRLNPKPTLVVTAGAGELVAGSDTSSGRTKSRTRGMYTNACSLSHDSVSRSPTTTGRSLPLLSCIWKTTGLPSAGSVVPVHSTERV